MGTVADLAGGAFSVDIVHCYLGRLSFDSSSFLSRACFASSFAIQDGGLGKDFGLDVAVHT